MDDYGTYYTAISATNAMTLARKHLGGSMESSARLALSDAVFWFNEGEFKLAKHRALASLAYRRRRTSCRLSERLPVLEQQGKAARLSRFTLGPTTREKTSWQSFNLPQSN